MPTNPHRSGITRRAKTRTQRLYFERLLLNAAHLKSEDVFEYHVQAQVPEAWDTLEQDVDVEEKKVKITLRLDESVAKFYRAMGNGYQARMNRILATFAQMRIAELRRLDDMLAEELAKVDEMRAERG
ncbi:hypothetical protein AIOL_003821 [Candidatus Rhodobacter oscarellae]|uniref:BrnA antitoxin of type II toxin-antitoxin system n=1 Tax=Candidatus Rhodobacter oscarellae TaxID=1675527 RepID=A0A0J9E7X1_9RHOB|nr:BrnA antitoxin family protein [Candidatus Rhodobacter lobularis]KMW58840.1 hypothetical protein AIOL_003821 [Candidatus Rhodobacter lobularis]